MFSRLRDILEMIRFSHTVFALPFALLSAVMAWMAPVGESERLPAELLSTDHIQAGRIPFDVKDLAGILLCMVFARSAAMAFNRLADRRIDAENPRTMNRHLPSGRLSVAAVAGFTAATSGAFIASTLLFLPNWLPIALAVPVLLFLFGYSFTKRFTSLAHFWLGVSLMLAPICAWIALRGEAVIADPADLLPAAVLGASVLMWVAGFDIIYACQDVEFDVAARLRSVPARLGVRGALRLAAACHGAMVLLLASLPLLCPTLGFGPIYWTGVAAVALLLIYEHAIVRPDDLTRVNVAFFHVNSIVSLGLFVVCTLDLIW